jgi:ABC-type glycerol-3-phosphate transport system permease component
VRRHRLINFLATVLVISMGVVTLIGLVSDQGTTAANMTEFLVQLVAVTGAVAVLVGIINLIAVHLDRFVRVEHGWPYSLIVLVTALVVVVLRILDRADIWPDDLEGEQVSLRVFESVVVSLESALAALVLFFLIYAAYRLMRQRVTGWNILFSAAVLIGLLGWIPLDGLEALADLRDWIVQVPASAGARGLLIGVGLGTVTAGVRVLIGQDRSFRSQA